MEETKDDYRSDQILVQPGNPSPQEDYYLFPCPHCKADTIVRVRDTACAIFRHAAFRESGQQIPPHASKQQIDAWRDAGKLVGCGKPFRLTKEGLLSVCGYI